MDKLFERADKVAHLSTLTLLYRAIPAGQYSQSAFCEECVTMAHEALEEHHRCIETLRNVQDNMVEVYLQWYVSLLLFFTWSTKYHQDHLGVAIRTLHCPFLPFY